MWPPDCHVALNCGISTLSTITEHLLAGKTQWPIRLVGETGRYLDTTQRQMLFSFRHKTRDSAAWLAATTEARLKPHTAPPYGDRVESRPVDLGTTPRP